jgi:hypothetical protein
MMSGIRTWMPLCLWYVSLLSLYRTRYELV